VNKLQPPHVNDYTVLKELSLNSSLSKTSFPHIKDNIRLIRKHYRDYRAAKGNAFNLQSDSIPNELKSGLISNYKYPPKNLDFIKLLRNKTPDCCPMCGSSHTFTLDHIFPKENFPVWSVYSLNLVPACHCNSKRGTILTGDAALRERVLHPYFDDCLNSRLLSCHIQPDASFRLADISVKCAVLNTDPLFRSANFHMESIVLKAGIVRSLEQEWIKLRRDPRNVILILPEEDELQNLDELIQLTTQHLHRLDRRNGSLNNWESVFIQGVLANNVLMGWILDRHNAIVRGEIDTEVE
jgi:hypothetical protein